MIDAIVQQRLRDTGQVLDPSNMLFLRAEAVSNSPRVLDKPVTALRLDKSPFDTTYGCCAEFISAFNTYKSSMQIESACIDLDGVTRICDADVYYALYTLGMQGFCNVAERSEACSKLFYTIMLTQGGTLTVSRVYNTLQAFKASTYFEKELVKALTVCLFNENSVVLRWLSLVEPQGFYTAAIERGRDFIKQSGYNEKQLRNFLQEQYALASSDKEFMKGIYKKVCNKWLTAMIYYLKDQYPEVTEYSHSKQGFM